MTNEEFMLQLYKCNSGEIINIEPSNKNAPAPIFIAEDGTKTYKFSSYGGQEWIHLYYIKFDKLGNFIDIEYREDESFC